MRSTALSAVVACLSVAALATAASPSGNPNGRAGAMPAYYCGQLFTINFNELPSSAETALLAHNRNLNIIYQSDPGLPGGVPFISVIDAFPGDGFNPLWVEVQIAFRPGFTPRQLVSDTEIGAAATNGEITLTPTDEVYRCSVIGPRDTQAPPSGGVHTLSGDGATAAPLQRTTWGALKGSFGAQP